MSSLSPGLTRSSPLSFPLTLLDGETISTIGDAADLFSAMAEERRQQNHWRLAIRMLDVALRERCYLKVATISLQTALVMDGRLDGMQG